MGTTCSKNDSHTGHGFDLNTGHCVYSKTGHGFFGLLKSSSATLLAAMVLAIACLMLPGCSCASPSVERSGTASLNAADTTAINVDDNAQNPIDFATLKKENDDVYAWIYLPDSAISLPILQNELIDNYYLEHDMYGNDSVAGALYTQNANALDFTDPVTVVYGHTFETDSDLRDEMFGGLHYLEDQAYFDSHPYFYIYLPDEVLKYEIVSAYEYDDRHILNSFDFSDEAELQKYFDYVANPDSMVKNVRSGVALKAGESSIVQLSTCTRPANDDARYIVTGALVQRQAIG